MPEFKEKIPQKRILVKEIDLSKTWDMESQRDLIIEKLKEWGMNPANSIFRGFDANKLDLMKKFGTDNPQDEIIFGSTEEELTEDDSMLMRSAINYAIRHESSGLAIYDKEKLTSRDGDVESAYVPQKEHNFKDALLLIIILK
ncbi:MAG: hypothetical protein Q8N88_04375 [Nanoarchaeota archaeon]|nr:hypothetical protein [Nanoarchaeota archaeon]